MISSWRIFWLEWLRLVRGRTLATLTVLALGWMLGFEYWVRGDGTVEGARELYVHYALGGVFLLSAMALVASAAGCIAEERESKRLQLTLVRPVRFMAVIGMKILAHLAVSAVVLALASGVLIFKTDPQRRCHQVLAPVLPSPAAEAREMYAAFMRDPATPAAVRKASKSLVLRILTQRALDHYQTIAPGETVSWQFAEPVSEGAVLRLRPSTPFSSKISEICVTNSLSYTNAGQSTVMLRPRRDVQLLIEADQFWRNLVRADLVLLVVLAAWITLAVLLSAGLSRPVVLFVVLSLMLVGEISPEVIDQYPDELHASWGDRMGLAITRAVAAVTRPVSSLKPLTALSQDECVEFAADLL